MKKIIFIVVVVFLVSVSGVHAAPKDADKGDAQSYTAIVPGAAAIVEWLADFTKLYKKEDIYKAVEWIVEKGLSPDEIVTTVATHVKKINPQNLVAAVYCAGVKHQDAYDAFIGVGYSDMIIKAGLKTAERVCGKVVSDAQAYTVVGGSRSGFAGPVGGNVSGGVYGSASGFPGQN